MKTTVMTNKETIRRTSAMAAALMMVAVSANAIVVSADQPAPQLKIESITAESGQSVDINVEVNGDCEFTSFGAKLEYDSALHYTGCSDKNSSVSKAGGSIWIEENYAEGGIVAMLGFASSLKPAQSGNLLTLHFNIPRTAEPGTVYNISWYDVDEFASEDMEYTPEVINGSITIKADYELEYKVENGYATVIGCTGDPTNVRIPEYHNGMPVVGIEKDAFTSCENLESVEISGEVDEISDGAFGSDVEVKGHANTKAQEYAEKNNLTFVAQGEAVADGIRIDVDGYKFEYTDAVSFTKDNVHVVAVRSSGKEVPVENWHFGTTPQEAGIGTVNVPIVSDDTNETLGYVAIDTGVRGNVSDTGKISARDASLIFSAYKRAYKSGSAGLTMRQERLADYDGGGVITASDAAAAFSEFKNGYGK